MLIVNPVSMKYNGGKFFSRMSYFGNNATINITHIVVIPQGNATVNPKEHATVNPKEHTTVKQRSHLIFYLIGLGVGIIVAIF